MDVAAELRALQKRLRESMSGSDRDRVHLRALADRLRKTADTGSHEQVQTALAWLRGQR